eukprot:1295407-Pleurochrysis_carterae.AAC.1
MCDIIFGEKKTIAAAAAPAPSPAAATSLATSNGGAARQCAPGNRRRRVAPTGGYNVNVDNASPPVEDPPADEYATLGLLDDADNESLQSQELKEYLLRKFGYFASNVLDVLHVWEAYGH